MTITYGLRWEFIPTVRVERQPAFTVIGLEIPRRLPWRRQGRRSIGRIQHFLQGRWPTIVSSVWSETVAREAWYLYDLGRARCRTPLVLRSEFQLISLPAAGGSRFRLIPHWQ